MLFDIDKIIVAQKTQISKYFADSIAVASKTQLKNIMNIIDQMRDSS